MRTAQNIADSVRSLLLDAPVVGRDDVGQAIDSVFNQIVIGGDNLPNEGQLRDAVQDRMLGFGVLQPLLDNPEIEEIWVNKPNQVFYAIQSAVHILDCQLSDDEIRTLTLRMLRSSGRRVDTSLPFADAILPDGSRLHVVIPDVTARHWSINIRKFPQAVLTIADLEACGTLAVKAAGILREAVAQGQNILISGATHSGKTTVLCALMAELPAETRLVSCEETFELRSNLRDWVAMQARQPNLEGNGEIPLRRLVKEALRMRPDRLVVGEVREGEALDLLIAMNSGVAGACTIHANSAAAAITKLCTLPLLAGPNIAAPFVRDTVGSAVNLVVHCTLGSDGCRRVTEIAEVEPVVDSIPTVRRIWP